MSLAIPRTSLDHLSAGRRRSTWIVVAASASVILCVVLAAAIIPPEALATNARARFLAPSLAHLFGTDALGRDMLVRTVKGLAVSLRVGLIAAATSVLIAFCLGLLSTFSRVLDALIGGLIDLTLGLPHLVLLVLIAYALGGGTNAVIVAVAVTHWPRLARVVRAEILYRKAADCVQVSRSLGRTPLWIARHHYVPHLVPQLIVGFVLMFPHAILHEAGLTFLGFGLEPHLPAIGVLLSESMRYLTAGFWWLAVLPGAALVLLTVAFDTMGEGLRRILDPVEAQT
jgi:peptide/nickel transport system permease protein